ncbi:helix-turn-helix domain-containing protein [Emcibacter nanhaiensis]|uniref:Helix-turn-helix domain-containing protein n=1 Tax=Emcibacter nanhaiensis TaxID=1505037 RepID=A0A501PB66_9PROT|nr:XRE family transcriptional regulator [Emcibacter nanhaiensis]TPD57603.1 helix-turn-helix domain-containing protein [Emcibacter nanhaiensis]
MGTTLNEKLATFSPERQKRIKAAADRMEQHLTLQKLRKARELTQEKVATTLHVKQATVAQFEKRSDLLLSTLRQYVKAVGGELKLVVDFPGQPPIVLDGLGEEAQERLVFGQRAKEDKESASENSAAVAKETSV